jgi:hypothetical protein
MLLEIRKSFLPPGVISASPPTQQCKGRGAFAAKQQRIALRYFTIPYLTHHPALFNAPPFVN